MEITTPGNNSLITELNATVEATYEDESQVTCELNLDDGGWEPMSVEGDIAWGFIYFSEGKHTLTVRCIDSSMNVGEARIYFEGKRIIGDEIPPNVEVIVPENNSRIIRSNITVLLTYWDENPVTCEVDLDGGGWQQMDVIGNSGSLFLPLTVGEHILTVRCADSYMNSRQLKIYFRSEEPLNLEYLILPATYIILVVVLSIILFSLYRYMTRFNRMMKAAGGYIEVGETDKLFKLYLDIEQQRLNGRFKKHAKEIRDLRRSLILSMIFDMMKETSRTYPLTAKINFDVFRKIYKEMRGGVFDIRLKKNLRREYNNVKSVVLESKD